MRVEPSGPILVIGSAGGVGRRVCAEVARQCSPASLILGDHRPERAAAQAGTVAGQQRVPGVAEKLDVLGFRLLGRATGSAEDARRLDRGEEDSVVAAVARLDDRQKQCTDIGMPPVCV